MKPPFLAAFLILAPPVSATDVGYYGLGKYQSFFQNSSSPPTLDDTFPPYSFGVSIQHQGVYAGQVFKATAKLPDATGIALKTPPPEATNGLTGWASNESAPPGLSTDLPPGTYALPDGHKSPATMAPGAAPWARSASPASHDRETVH